MQRRKFLTSAGIAAVGSDSVWRGSKHCGSILIDKMTIAGD